MYRIGEAITVLAALAQTISAHGVIFAVAANGNTQNGGANSGSNAVWSYQGPDPYGPVSREGYSDVHKIACNYNGQVGATQVDVKAGTDVQVTWTTGQDEKWPHEVGPILDYLARAPDDFKQASVENLQFFKIAESAIENGQWTMKTKLKATNKWNVSIPATIKQGNYVLRHEPIGLHLNTEGASGPEHFPICINLKVSGGGSDEPKGVLGNQLYNTEQAELQYNPYASKDPYPFPGPEKVSLGSGNQAGAPVISSTAIIVPKPATVAQSSTIVPVTHEEGSSCGHGCAVPDSCQPAVKTAECVTVTITSTLTVTAGPTNQPGAVSNPSSAIPTLATVFIKRSGHSRRHRGF